jgi:hypothetical protein
MKEQRMPCYISLGKRKVRMDNGTYRTLHVTVFPAMHNADFILKGWDIRLNETILLTHTVDGYEEYTKG